METSSYETNIRLRPLRLPMLLQARQMRSPAVIAMRSSTGSNALRPSGDDHATPFYRDSFMHPIAISRPFIDSNIDSPSSPGSLIWTTTSQSDSSSPVAPFTPTTGSGIVYFSTSNPRPIRPVSAPPTLSQIPLNSTEANISLPVALSVYCPTVELEEQTARIFPPHHEESNSCSNAAEGLNTHPSTVTSHQEVADMYDISTDWIDFPSFCLDSDLGAEWAQFRTNQPTAHNHITKRSHRLRSRLKTALKKFSDSMKPKRTVPVSLSISPPAPLELPGYNGSIALSLSSPIQVARFLYASEDTHMKRHKTNKFPRINRGLPFDPPVKFGRHLSVPGFAVDTFPGLDMSPLDNSFPPSTEQSITHPKQRTYIERKHGQIDQFTMNPNCDRTSFSLPSQTLKNPSSPDSLDPKKLRVVDASICTDVVHAKTTLRSSSPSRLSVKSSHMGSQRDPTTHVTGAIPPFDPERMPFATKRFKEKSYLPSSRSIPHAPQSYNSYSGFVSSLDKDFKEANTEHIPDS